MKYYNIFADEFYYPVNVFATSAKDAKKEAAGHYFPADSVVVACVDRTKHSGEAVDVVEDQLKTAFREGNISVETYTFVKAAIAEYREKLKKLDK